MTNDERAAWLETIKAGDSVIIMWRNGNPFVVGVAKRYVVDEVTAKIIIVNRCNFDRKSGRKSYDAIWPDTPEALEYLKSRYDRESQISRIRALMNDASMNALAAAERVLAAALDTASTADADGKDGAA